MEVRKEAVGAEVAAQPLHRRDLRLAGGFSGVDNDRMMRGSDSRYKLGPLGRVIRSRFASSGMRMRMQ